MAENSFTEVTTKSYGQNVKNSFGGIIAGIILFLISVFLLWSNEGNLAKQNQIADFINKNAIPVESSVFDNSNDNKLISVSGNAITAETLSDGIISVPDALVLSRTVEMYQWRENEETKTETQMGGSTKETKTYSYEKVWSENSIDSSKFRKTSYYNPPFPLKSERYEAQKGEFGAFTLSKVQTSALRNTEDYTNLPQNNQYTISGNYYYKGNNINSPSVGDIRISYSYMPSGSPISVIGMQRADKTITPMTIKQGRVYVQYDGLLSQAEMVEKFKHGNLVTTNIFRLVGFILMFIGLNLMIRPLATLLSFIPLFSNIVSFVTGGLVFLLAALLSLIIIAAAWFFYRPVLAICLLVIAGVLIFLIKNKMK